MFGLSSLFLCNNVHRGFKRERRASFSYSVICGPVFRGLLICGLVLSFLAVLYPSVSHAALDRTSLMKMDGSVKLSPLVSFSLRHVVAKQNQAVAKQNEVRVAGSAFFNSTGMFDPYGQTSEKARKKSRYTRTYKKYKKKYKLGAKLPKKGYVKSYKYNNSIDFDESDIFEYKAPRRNKRYQRRAKGRYRTMCVRLHDGYYWPINFSQKKSRLKKDQIKCQKSCSDEVRLYYYPSTSPDLAQMRDLKGRRYAALKTAFLYRTKYIKGANCKPKPWSAAAKAKHADYAVKDSEKKRKMHVAATKRAEKKRVASLNRKARKVTRKRGRRYVKKRARSRRKVARYRRKKRYRRYSSNKY